MQFFLYEIVARIVAIWVGYSCGRTLCCGTAGGADRRRQSSALKFSNPGRGLCCSKISSAHEFRAL
jgi:hypothetical protein